MRIDNDLFPFRFQFDRHLRVTEIGPSLSKLARNCQVGCLLEDLVRPLDGAWPSSVDAIRKQLPSAFDLVVRESGVKLRCQLVETDEELAVLGSPRFDSFADLEASGLSVNDFASHDAAVELLLLRDARSGEIEEEAEPLESPTFEPDTEEPSQESLFQILNAAGDIYLRMTRDGIVLEATTTRAELLPSSPKCLEQTSVFESCPQFATSLRTAFDDLGKGEERVSFAFEITRDGTRICLEANAAKTSFGEVVMLARDITEQRTLKAQLLHRANHDALTNLPNRTCFMEYVEDALQTTELNAVFFIDLDGFKLVNDRHGHQMGDELLMHVAKTIRKCLRPGDCAARLGGDEFSILLRGLDSKQTAEDVASKILVELQKPARIGHRKMAASASIGIATSYDSRDITTLFQFADVAMYEAKARHKCCYVVFEAAMYEDLVRRDTLQQQLIAAGQQGQFINHYQPIVHIPTNQSQGFEALARWEHPIRGLLLPGEFLRTAEETEAIVRLGEHTVANVCQDLVQWKSDGLFSPKQQPKIHVNVSPMQLIKGCSGMLEETLTEFGIEHDRLTIEVKEQTLQEHFEAARLEISKLHDLGFRLAIDDFGAGNSSLAFLDRLPVTGIKLARSFVGYLGQKQQRNRLVQAVVELALEFGLEVVAVGVETPEQCELLMSFGCTLGQGEFFSEPISSRNRDAIRTSLHGVAKHRSFSASCV